MPFRRRLRISFGLLTILTALILIPRDVKAGVGFQPVSQEELKMTSDPAAPGAPAIILFREVDRDDNGRTSHEDNYVRIKILTEAGRKYADVEIPFAKDIRDLSNVRARSIAPDGTITNFEGKLFEKTIVKARGINFRAKVFTLPNVQVGGIIEYYYTYDLPEHFIFDSHWILSEELFTREAKFSLKGFNPRYGQVSIRWTWSSLPPGTNPPAESPDHVIRLEAHNIPAFQTEDYMPPLNELKSRVDFIYSLEPPERDKDKFWAQVDKKRYEQLESFLGKYSSLQSAVAQIVSPSDDPEVKLRKIYARVQQLRNTSYEVHKTEAEAKRENPKEIKNVEDIWKNGYGSGGQLTWLYLALVRAAGFEAYGVWVADREHYFFDPSQMDASRLDANAVLVKVNGKDIYCDPGSAFAPFGFLPWYETGVQGLRLDKEGGTWIRTPLPDSSLSQVIRKADLKLSDDGDLTGKLTVTYSGLEAIRKRIEERHADDEHHKEYLEHLVKEYIPAGGEIELEKQPDWNSSSLEMTAEFKIKIPGWASSAGKHVLVPIGLFAAPEKGLFEHANRIYPVYFEFPMQKIDDIRIELPSGWKFGNLPAPQNQGGDAVSYSLKTAMDKSTLRITRTLRLNVLIVSVQQYSVLRGFFQMVRTADEAQVMVEPQVATASN